MIRYLAEMDMEDILERLDYTEIYETMRSQKFKSGVVQGLYKFLFTERERKVCSKIFDRCKEYYFNGGVPEKLTVYVEEKLLWKRLRDFCMTVHDLDNNEEWKALPK